MHSPLIQLGSAPPRELKIGDLAKASKKTTRALRLYEELGLLTPGTRTVGGFRVYGSEAVGRVAWIGKLQDLGFTLQQIQELVVITEQDQLPRQAMGHVRALFHEKLDDVQAQIERLQQLKKELHSSLAYLETCTSCSHDEAHSVQACGTCRDHGSTQTPDLVEGMRVHPASQPSSSSASSHRAPSLSHTAQPRTAMPRTVESP